MISETSYWQKLDVNVENRSKSLKNNEAPFEQPYARYDNIYVDDNGVSKLEFKLFAKKTFTQNLVANKDLVGSAQAGFALPVNFKIVWTIDFRSKHEG